MWIGWICDVVVFGLVVWVLVLERIKSKISVV